MIAKIKWAAIPGRTLQVFRSSLTAEIKRAAIHGRTLQGLILLLCLLLPVLAHAAGVQATLDRSSMQLGETVTLNLHVDGGGNVAMPDLSPLQQDFDILGRSQSSSLSIVNGKRSAELVIGVVLRPKHAGTLTIPSLTVAGAQTTPLTVEVDAPNPAAAATMHKSLFMEAEVVPRRAWVGQQLSYVVRLYYSGNISSGSLDTPQIDGVQLSQVGGDLRYDAVRGGRQYHVIERRYALVPQHAGTLAIPALGFQGEALDPSDPDSFFGAGTPVSASAPALAVPVQAAPADWGKSAWLPARALSLTLSGWPDANTSVRVGQPINLVMKLSATGLPFETLPVLSLPTLRGATVYPDQPATATANDGPWLVGSRQRAFAVVPEQAGTLTLPATTLRWFDVDTGQEQTAEIPAHSITVLPAVGAAAVPPAAGASASPASSSAPAAPGSVAAASSNAMPHDVMWRWIALASLLLWLLSVLAWWLWRRRAAQGPAMLAAGSGAAESVRRVRQAFLAAARGRDAGAQLRGLLAWAQAERPAIQHPGALHAALADEAQRRALAELQHRCYGAPAPAAAGGDDLAKVFKHGFAWRATEKADDGSLPPLYPFKL
ncbi:BatD family protein [Rhodanobacter sp. C06]|uniref:BatD family protein n=1 Tax=Rhodanobacter sp. C06 TaxID=1945854 RepID=UPI000987C0D8|nr:BatD family protein [Rhodanobacter sp. C06]